MPSSQIKTEGTTLKLSSNVPARTGYKFNGWATSANGTVEYIAGANYPENSNAILYANWSILKYTLTFNANGGSVSTPSISQNYGTAITLPTPTRTGYTFAGWYTAASGGNRRTYTTMLAANENLYAHWTPITYTVAYNANGGSGSMASVTHTYDSARNLRNTSGTITLFAKWTPITYTVTYNPNGGSGSMASITHTYDIAKNLTANAFTRSGYKFIGWSTSTSGSVEYTDEQSVINLRSTSGTVNLYAVWQVQVTTITAKVNSAYLDTVKPLVTCDGTKISTIYPGGPSYIQIYIPANYTIVFSKYNSTIDYGLSTTPIVNSVNSGNLLDSCFSGSVNTSSVSQRTYKITSSGTYYVVPNINNQISAIISVKDSNGNTCKMNLVAL